MRAGMVMADGYGREEGRRVQLQRERESRLQGRARHISSGRGRRGGVGVGQPSVDVKQGRAVT